MEIMATFIAFRKRGGLRELLFLRARDMYYLMLPGGVQQVGESIEASLQRTVSEQFTSTIQNMTSLGTVNGHTPDGRIVIMHLFTGEIGDDFAICMPGSQAEWMDKSRANLHAGSMSTMLLDKTLPYLERQGLW